MDIITTKYPSLGQLTSEISDLHSKKLWHNITEKLEQLVSAKEFEQKPAGDDLLLFYEAFIAKFELRTNLLKLALITVAISSKQSDPKRAVAFLEGLYGRIEKEKRRDRERSEALVILKIELAAWQLRTGELDACKKTLEQAKEAMDKEGYVDTIVNSTYYRVKSDYLLRSEEFSDYYKNALLFLAYTPIETIPIMQQKAIAFDIGIAALVGDKVYNFGELLMHPVVESLQNTQAEWLYQLLFAFNKGDIPKYKQLVQQYAGEIQGRKVLADKKQFLEDKIQLMCLMDLVFSKAAGDRKISFGEVSKVTGKPMDLVEFLLLKALAYNLIKGVIDQVAQTIHVSWVQPRVLDKTQIGSVNSKIGQWLSKVDETISFLEKEGASNL